MESQLIQQVYFTTQRRYHFDKHYFFINIGNVYFSENGVRVRKVTVSTSVVPSPLPTTMPSKSPTTSPTMSPNTDIITTFAGTGTGGYSGDGGPATSATLYWPSTGIIQDSDGNIFYGEYYNNCVRKITLSTGIISRIAGNGNPSYGGDGGQATAASLSGPFGVALDSTGIFIIAIS